MSGQNSSGGITAEQAEKIAAALRTNPNQLTLQLARELGVPEVEVIRAMPDGRSVEFDASRWEEIFRSLEPLGKLHVIVSNGSVTCEVIGAFGGFSTWGEFFNVQSGSLDLHIRWQRLARVFAVEKPGHLDTANDAAKRRGTLSVQFYDQAGDAALKVFVHFSGTCPPDRQAAFDALRERFRQLAPA
jgi:putative heme iron utilization protein